MNTAEENRLEDEAVTRLKELAKSSDTEQAHSEADEIILKFCPHRVVTAWRKIEKWYA